MSQFPILQLMGSHKVSKRPKKKKKEEDEEL